MLSWTYQVDSMDQKIVVVVPMPGGVGGVDPGAPAPSSCLLGWSFLLALDLILNLHLDFLLVGEVAVAGSLLLTQCLLLMDCCLDYSIGVLLPSPGLGGSPDGPPPAALWSGVQRRPLYWI